MVLMRMWLRAIPSKIMLVLVVGVMAVPVVVVNGVVFVLVFMRFGQMQPDPRSHQRGG